MKKIKYIIPFVLLFVFLFSFEVFAEDPYSDVYCESEFKVGDVAYYYSSQTQQNPDGQTYKYYQDVAFTITSDTQKLCLYLYADDRTPSGYLLKIPNNGFNVVGGDVHFVKNNEYQYVSFYSAITADQCTPACYSIPDSLGRYIISESSFNTNIPIFASYEDAQAYINGELEINNAVNYKKQITEDGSWVRAFEDIEINDNDLLVPSLSNLSHNGFTITNRAENYGVDIYVVSGLRDPGEIIRDLPLNLSDYYYGNTLGWLTNGDKVYTQDSFDLVKDFGVDNVTLLNESVNSFYTQYPSARSYYPDSNFLTKVFYNVWGEPFGVKYFSYNDVYRVTASDLSRIDCYDVPLCFTNYKVRFYYYDENDGMHYGPWAVVTYCSNGDVKASTSYVGSDGDVIDTPVDFGRQDEQGNISFDYNNNSEFIDLGDVNSLFGNIRSIFNNISATNSSFSQLFASVFNFLPPEILAIIFGGIVAMVFIGIIKACV